MTLIIDFWRWVTHRDGPQAPSYATRRARELRCRAEWDYRRHPMDAGD